MLILTFYHALFYNQYRGANTSYHLKGAATKKIPRNKKQRMRVTVKRIQYILESK